MNCGSYSIKGSLSVSALVLMGALSVALAASERDPVGYAELRKEAEAAYRKRDGELAQALFLELTEAFPDDPEAWFGLSRAYEWTEELGLAIHTAERSYELGWVSRPYFSYRLARLYARAGQQDPALDWLERALQDRYESRPSIQHDDAFATLREHPRFMRLAGIVPDDVDSREEGLRFDLEYLVEEAQRMHAGPERPAYSQAFLSASQSLRAEIPALTDAEVLGRFMRLTAILNDGHSAIYGPDADTPLQISGKILPLRFYWFEEGVYIVDGLGSASEFAGSRVVKIGRLTTEEALRRMAELRGTDNAMTFRWLGPQFYLGQLQMLEVIGASDSTDGVVLELEDRNGRIGRHRFEGGFDRVQRKLRPSPAMPAEIPLYLSDVDTQYWTKYLPDLNAIYFQFNQVRDSERMSIEEFAADLKQQIGDTGAETLIVDVRHNNGGNNGLLKPLLGTIVGFEQASHEHRVFVITGRNTFSAAQNFINRLERLTDATYVGEPSSSSPNFVGEETDLLLPWSRLRGSISTRYWQDSDPGDQRQWITPTVPVEPTAADYFAGHDAALEAISRLVTGR